MICVKKYGGSLLKNENDLSKISYDIVNDFTSCNKNEKTKFIIVVSSFNGVTKKLQKDFNHLTNKDDSNEASYLVTGELMIVPLLSSLINNYGIKSIALNAFQIELLTDDNYLDAKIISVNKDKIDTYLLDYDILVICGYQGINAMKEFTTLGFNGSDYTALYLASTYNVDCEIYKDYPLKISNSDSSKWIPYLSYHQMEFLINYGLEIFQAKFIELAKQTKTKIILKGYTDYTIISNKEYISNRPLNIQLVNCYKIKIYSPYINSKPFVDLIKKNFNGIDIIKENDYLSLLFPKKNLTFIEEKSLLILNNFKNTTFIIDDYFEYQLIFPNLQIFKIKKTDQLNFELLEEGLLC